MKANRGLVYFAHMKTLQDCGTELGVRSAIKELVQLNQEPVVGVLRLDLLHGAFVPRAASTCFQIDTHFLLSLMKRRISKVSIELNVRHFDEVPFPGAFSSIVVSVCAPIAKDIPLNGGSYSQYKYPKPSLH